MSDPVLQWVIVQGERRHVSDFAEFSPEKRPEMRCPVCNHVVISKLGKIRVFHAAHQVGSNCVATESETILHLNAKYHLEYELKHGNFLFFHQKCEGWKDWLDKTQHSDFCKKQKRMAIAKDWTDVQVEYSVGSYRTDVALLRDKEVVLVIEVHVTHPVDQDKKEYMVVNGIPWVEISVTNDEFYSGEKAWHIDKPLPLEHGSLLQLKSWICPPCQQMIERQKELHDKWSFKGLHDLVNQKPEPINVKIKEFVPLIRFIDYYYKSGKHFREHFTAHISCSRSDHFTVVVNRGYYRRDTLEIGSCSANIRKDALEKATSLVEEYLKKEKGKFEKAESRMTWQPWHESLFENFSANSGKIVEILPVRYVHHWNGWMLKNETEDVSWDNYWWNLAKQTIIPISPTDDHPSIVCILCGVRTTDYSFVDVKHKYCRCNECLENKSP